jgi:hypothetical protein
MASLGQRMNNRKEELLRIHFIFDRLEIYKCTIMLNDQFDYSSCTLVTTMLELLLF